MQSQCTFSILLSPNQNFSIYMYNSCNEERCNNDVMCANNAGLTYMYLAGGKFPLSFLVSVLSLQSMYTLYDTHTLHVQNTLP